MTGETFILDFITGGEGQFTINEPEGYDATDFTIKQKDKGYGRHVSFSGGEVNYTFRELRDHKLELLLYYYNTYGWESRVQLIIEKDGIENIIGDLDFKEPDTNNYDFFSCKVIQNLNESIIEKRNDIEVDVFSDENIDLEYIEPLTTENVLVKSKPVNQISTWETPSIFEKQFVASERDSPGVSMSLYVRLNPSISLTSYEIDDSYTFFESSQETGIVEPPKFGDDFELFKATNNLRNITVDITNLDFFLETSVRDGGNGYVNYDLVLKYGQDYETATTEVLMSGSKRENQSFADTSDYSYFIPYLNREDSVWLHYSLKVRQSRNVGNPAPGTDIRFITDVTVNSMDVKVKATSVAYNTIVPSIRLYDGVSQVVKSISGLETVFPFAQPNGEMYNQRLFNGNLLRNLTDRPFNISMKSIEDWLPEINGDYEVNDTVFFGLYKDFYRPVEVAVFDTVTFDDYRKQTNSRYAVNQFNYKYKKFASQKENEVSNTFDIVHGEAQMSVLNKGVENNKEIDIEFVRDSFEIDEQRRKALEIKDSTSTKDDQTTYILDTLERTGSTEFTETDFIQHTFTDGRLKITNTGTFSFILIGLATGEQFTINGSDENAGTYTIYEVSDRYILLDGLASENNNGERVTSFTYTVSLVTAPFISWSDEGFDYIDGIIDKDGFANLKYTIKRNVRRFYESYLATCNLFSKKPIKITDYTNNRDLSLSYNDLQTVEGERFTPSNPLLGAYVHQTTVLTDFNTFKNLEQNLRSERGYVRTFDSNGHVIKLFPQEMVYDNYEQKLLIIGEEKFEKSVIDITYQGGQGYIIVNNEYRMPKLSYRVEDEKYFIMDDDGRLLYNGAYWHKISINGATPETKEKLEEWLTLIS